MHFSRQPVYPKIELLHPGTEIQKFKWRKTLCSCGFSAVQSFYGICIGCIMVRRCAAFRLRFSHTFRPVTGAASETKPWIFVQTAGCDIMSDSSMRCEDPSDMRPQNSVPPSVRHYPVGGQNAVYPYSLFFYSSSRTFEMRQSSSRYRAAVSAFLPQ